MKVLSHIRSLTAIAILITTASGAQANLLTNGGFESSSSTTTTPTGWTNIGHSDGVITYSAFGTPAYEGSNFYDFGGYGDAYGPIGDGIAQTFATTAGSIYSVTFGLSSENYSGNQTLTVSAAGTSFDYFLGVTGDGTFRRPFSTQTFNFTATGTSTTLSFIQTAGGGGNNDALIDGVTVAAAVTAVPEPETYAMMLAGLGLMGAIARRRKAKQTA